MQSVTDQCFDEHHEVLAIAAQLHAKEGPEYDEVMTSDPGFLDLLHGDLSMTEGPLGDGWNAISKHMKNRRLRRLREAKLAPIYEERQRLMARKRYMDMLIRKWSRFGPLPTLKEERETMRNFRLTKAKLKVLNDRIDRIKKGEDDELEEEEEE